VSREQGVCREHGAKGMGMRKRAAGGAPYENLGVLRAFVVKVSALSLVAALPR
jgi:hypothetical protein